MLVHRVQSREPLDVDLSGHVATVHLPTPLSLSEPWGLSTHELQGKGAHITSALEHLIAGADPREFSASSGQCLLRRGRE